MLSITCLGHPRLASHVPQKQSVRECSVNNLSSNCEWQILDLTSDWDFAVWTDWIDTPFERLEWSGLMLVIVSNELEGLSLYPQHLWCSWRSKHHSQNSLWGCGESRPELHSFCKNSMSELVPFVEMSWAQTAHAPNGYYYIQWGRSYTIWRSFQIGEQTRPVKCL